MKENIKSRLTIILVSVATLCLAGIAIFTATKIFQSRKGSVTPTTPEIEPLAQIPTSTPTPIPTASPTFALTPTPTGLLAQAGSPTPTIRITLTPSPTPLASSSATLTPTRKPSISPTVTPAALPDSGFSFPTLIGVSIGILLLVAGFLLAL